MKKTYITTSIAYVNAEPHIGFLYELLAGDVLKRYYQARGKEVFLLTGTDEHGIKVAQAATASGKEPQEFVDEISKKFEQLGKDFNINFDYFIRTTNPEHKNFVQERWQQLEKAGVLKKKKYSGLYCPGCEAFKTEGEIESGRCSIHEKELEKIEEENWFLVITEEKKKKIEEWINSSVYPETRRQEAINVLKSGSYDEVSLSRSKERYGWGVPVPGDYSQIMYVWVDALFNYISALTINNQEDLWPADTQIVGKDIVKFHAIIWPALLIACGYQLPHKLLVHGFINSDGKKMSKSLGNVISPSQLTERYGIEASRYLIFRGLSFFEDSNFTWGDFDRLYNGELANGLGNLVARIVGIGKKIEKFELQDQAKDSVVAGEIDFKLSLEQANSLINRADGVITTEKLWENPSEKVTKFEEAVRHLLDASSLLAPFLPETSKEILRQLKELDSKPLFPRLG
ncbi:MAG: methionine--tRNA ligase [Candidatus Berkelbacteria bacterium]|nr:methionine--tRNA ligase [Candidatus Berkelbacteria bacterium]